MARDSLTGSRIRERRVMIGMKQAELARRAEISASYLNLIEHNRRRIGGKLLLDIADILRVEPNILTEGAEATLIAALREAATELPEMKAELARVDEFAGRFPGWAALLAASRSRIADLERTVVALTDRLTHDPHLAASLHDMLTTVTAIRSTASILAEPGEIEPEWQDRFHRNINEDSSRLAETSQALVRYLDTSQDATSEIRSPQDEIDDLLSRHDFRFPAIESGEATPAQVIAQEGEGLSTVARKIFRSVLFQLRADVAAVPRETAVDAMRRFGCDPFVLAHHWRVDPALAMRRIVALAQDAKQPEVGLAICDASGTLIFRKPLQGFPLPRSGGACPMLPLYQALGHPMLPIATQVLPVDRGKTAFQTFSYANPTARAVPGQPTLMQAQMLVVPASGEGPETLPTEVGVSCRICAKTNCPGRREPSILSGGL